MSKMQSQQSFWIVLLFYGHLKERLFKSERKSFYHESTKQESGEAAKECSFEEIHEEVRSEKEIKSQITKCEEKQSH